MIDRIERWAELTGYDPSLIFRVLSGAQYFFLALWVRLVGIERLASYLSAEAYCWLREVLHYAACV